MFLHQEAHPLLKLTEALHVADWSFLVSPTAWPHLMASLPPSFLLPSSPSPSLLPLSFSPPSHLYSLLITTWSKLCSNPSSPLLFTELAPTPLSHTSHSIIKKIYGYDLQTASGSEHSLPPQAAVRVQTHAHHPLARLFNGPRCCFIPPPSSFLCSERVCSHCPHGGGRLDPKTCIGILTSPSR